MTKEDWNKIIDLRIKLTDEHDPAECPNVESGDPCEECARGEGIEDLANAIGWEFGFITDD